MSKYSFDKVVKVVLSSLMILWKVAEKLSVTFRVSKISPSIVRIDQDSATLLNQINTIKYYVLWQRSSLDLNRSCPYRHIVSSLCSDFYPKLSE